MNNAAGRKINELRKELKKLSECSTEKKDLLNTRESKNHEKIK